MDEHAPVTPPANESIFCELARLSEQMLERVRRQEIESVGPLARRSESLLHAAAAAPLPLSHEDQAHLDHARQTQQRIRLMLASQKDGTARQLDEIGTGRRALHAYGQEPIH